MCIRDRCKVNAEFDSNLHERLYKADFENLENPLFLDKQEKAKKFLYCDWHGFGYLLDSALCVVGQFFTLIGIAAVIVTLNAWIVLLFVILTVLGAMIEGNAKKKAIRLSEVISADQRGWMYFAKLFEDFSYGHLHIHQTTCLGSCSPTLRWLSSSKQHSESCES